MRKRGFANLPPLRSRYFIGIAKLFLRPAYDDVVATELLAWDVLALQNLDPWSDILRGVYAVSHAATALPLKRQFPRVGLWPLLIAVQAIELLWVIFTYVGVEHIVVSDGRIHLGFLPYSHSVGSTLALAGVAWIIVKAVWGDKRVATAIALAIVSHIVLDIIQHEPDIRLLPLSVGPKLGFGLTLKPVADALVEMFYGVLCWWVFGGGWPLLGGILILNALDLPFMFAKADGAERIAQQPAILTTVVLMQIVVSWVVIWALARRRSAQLTQACT